MYVVSFNMRYATAQDNQHSFFHRKDLILSAINTYQPDIIGFQEVLPFVQTWLAQHLSNYLVLGVGRNSDLSGEACSIAIRKDRLKLLAINTFWLSPTPKRPGSRFADQSNCPRIATVAYLQDYTSGRIFRLYNTHLDHQSASARDQAIQCILNNINIPLIETDSFIPTLLVGDFNAQPNSQEIAHLISVSEKASQLKDTTSDILTSFHNFEGESYKDPNKIDYIFASQDFSYHQAHCWLDNDQGVYLSDHYPIGVYLTF